MNYYLENKEIPTWFKYPDEYVRIVNQSLTDLSPWFILEGENILKKFKGLQERYPKRDLIPFARRQDNDDVACWSKVDPSKVYIIHDFASENWEDIQVYNSFWDWFKKAIDDMIGFS